MHKKKKEVCAPNVLISNSSKNERLQSEDRNDRSLQGSEAQRQREKLLEATPRSTTQSKKLKWDQTPIGTFKIQESPTLESKCDIPLSDTTVEERTINYTKEELNLILPTKGYKIAECTIKNLEKELSILLYEIKNGFKVKNYKRWKNTVIEILSEKETIMEKEIEDFNQIILERATLLILNTPMDEKEEKNILLFIKAAIEDETGGCKCCSEAPDPFRKIEYNFYTEDFGILEEKKNEETGSLNSYNKELLLILGIYSKKEQKILKEIALDTLRHIFKNTCSKRLILELKEEISGDEGALWDSIADLILEMYIFYGFEAFKPLFTAIRKTKYKSLKLNAIRLIIKIIRETKTTEIFYFKELLEHFLFTENISLAADGLSLITARLNIDLEISERIIKILEQNLSPKETENTQIILTKKTQKLINLLSFMAVRDKKLNKKIIDILKRVEMNSRDSKILLLKIIARIEIKEPEEFIIDAFLSLEEEFIAENLPLYSKAIEVLYFKYKKELEEKFISLASDQEFKILAFKAFCNQKWDFPEYRRSKIANIFIESIEDEEILPLIPRILKNILKGETTDILKFIIEAIEIQGRKILGFRVLLKIIKFVNEDDLYYFLIIASEGLDEKDLELLQLFLSIIYYAISVLIKNARLRELKAKRGFTGWKMEAKSSNPRNVI